MEDNLSSPGQSNERITEMEELRKFLGKQIGFLEEDELTTIPEINCGKVKAIEVCTCPVEMTTRDYFNLIWDKANLGTLQETLLQGQVFLVGIEKTLFGIKGTCFLYLDERTSVVYELFKLRASYH